MEGLNYMDFYNYDQVSALNRRCNQLLSTSWSSAVKPCEDTMRYLDDLASLAPINSFDIRQTQTEWKAQKGIMEEFLSGCAKSD